MVVGTYNRENTAAGTLANSSAGGLEVLGAGGNLGDCSIKMLVTIS